MPFAAPLLLVMSVGVFVIAFPRWLLRPILLETRAEGLYAQGFGLIPWHEIGTVEVKNMPGFRLGTRRNVLEIEIKDLSERMQRLGWLRRIYALPRSSTAGRLALEEARLEFTAGWVAREINAQRPKATP